ANDYFDRNIGIILSQARKYNIGMVLAHQFLGQLDTKLQEAMSANTSTKFAGGVSAKDARAMAAELRTDPGFVEGQDKLSFAAFVKGSTRHAVSISIEAGKMENHDRLSDTELQMQREAMREQYAVHYTEINRGQTKEDVADDVDSDTATQPNDDSEIDDGEPTRWE
ncbi:MAG: ATP-binding protein, partial [Hyphomicrobiales bacterium]|nr:ATP-binding protein [Hyphomicrobiales bacterium]